MNDVPLPRDWPRHARGTVLKVLGIAHFGMTFVRGWCADSRIARVHLVAEADRLRTEIGLLNEPATLVSWTRRAEDDASELVAIKAPIGAPPGPQGDDHAGAARASAEEQGAALGTDRDGEGIRTADRVLS